jgi:hypothetical protein
VGTNIETFDCWVCDTQGVGPEDLSCHECNLAKFNARMFEYLLSDEGQFLTFLAKKLVNGATH